MIITKTTTRKYDIYDCAKWQMTVGKTISSREKIGMSTRGLNQCFVCKKSFNYDDYPYLALVKNHKNVFVCEECHKRILEEKNERTT